MWHHIRPEVYENILCQMPGVCICTHTVRLHHQDEPMHIDRRASLSPPTLYHISRLVWPRQIIFWYSTYLRTQMPYSTLWPRAANCMFTSHGPRCLTLVEYQTNPSAEISALEIVQGFPSMKFKANKTLSLNSLNMSLCVVYL